MVDELPPGVKLCLTCKGKVAKELAKCPHCGAAQLTPPNSPIAALFAVGFLAFGAYSFYSCSQAVSGAGKTTSYAATTPAETAPDCCAGQGENAPLEWHFSGEYVDSKCTRPLAEAFVPICSPVVVKTEVSMAFNEAVAEFTMGDRQNVKLDRWVDPRADVSVYLKREGVCSRMKDSPGKIAPTGCMNQRVCRTNAGSIGCDDCMTLPSGCKNFQGSVTFATFTPKTTVAPTGAKRASSPKVVTPSTNETPISAADLPSAPTTAAKPNAPADPNPY